MTQNEILHSFNYFSSWIRSLENTNEKLWFAPIADNKWSISEIIAHLFNWDRYLISEILPAVQIGNEVSFPDYDTFNKRASDYIQSGVSKSKLIDETVATRHLLVKLLHEMTIERLNRRLTVNGVSDCPRTGAHYSLIYIIKEFTEHDTHHKQQIMRFLSGNV
ncbi:DinB family protein [Paenibacillus sp. MMO-58]|uniref:DinB family protein n=1 Tax=Paenibacillus sp. MMO-58 TaxID=3081290 RepID=UPI00301B4F7B